jgi:hypothetical protein
VKENIEKNKSGKNAKTESIQKVYKEAKNMFDEINNKLEDVKKIYFFYFLCLKK